MMKRHHNPGLHLAVTFTLLVCLFPAPGVGQSVVWQCNFDSGSTTPCGMVQSSSDNFNWTPLNQSTPSANTGPPADHTSGSGFFMYIEASNKNVGEFADLDSPVFSSGTYCLKFWYHMLGQHIGRLEVYTVLQNGASFLRWTKSREGPDGVNEWRTDTVDITIDPSMSMTWNFRLRGVRGGETGGQPFGDIAIDDVSLENCAPTTASTTTTTTTTTTTAAPPASSQPASTQANTPTSSNAQTTPTVSSISTDPSQSQSTSSYSTTASSNSSDTSSPASSPTTTVTSGGSSAVSEKEEELWGLEERYWIIILSVAGFVILILLIVIVCQACALSTARTAHITRKTGDFDNFDGYTKYSGGPNGSAGRPTNGQGPFIDAYENGAFN